MAINYTNLFTDLGRLAKVHRVAAIFADGDLETAIDGAITELGTTYAAFSAALATGKASFLANPVNIGSTVQTAMQGLLMKYVNDDTLLASKTDLTLALVELIRQMKLDAQAVTDTDVSVTSINSVAGIVGTGIAAATVQRGDALEQENLSKETAVLTCVGDFQNGTATAGAEPWVYSGDQAPPSVYSHEWPGPSGASASLTTIDSQVDNNRNLLTNSGFELFGTPTANLPDKWTAVTGTPGTHIFEESTGSNVHRGSKSLRFLGDAGATLTGIKQTFNDAGGGTAGILRPNRVYGLHCWLKVSNNAATGTLDIALVDGTGTVVNDDLGAGNTAGVSLAPLTTTYQSVNAVILLGIFFRTPKTLPTGLALRLKLSTAISNGDSLYIDSLAMAEATYLYAGGPGICVYRGAVDFMTGDKFTPIFDNTQGGGQTYGGTWQRTFDRFFDMRSKGLLLPYATGGGITQADSLITS